MNTAKWSSNVVDRQDRQDSGGVIRGRDSSKSSSSSDSGSGPGEW